MHTGDTQAFVSLNKQIPLHFPCTQGIHRHLSIRTAETPTLSMHTVEMQAFANLNCRISYKLHTGMGGRNPFTIHAYSGLPGICYSWQRNLSCIPIHHPCIQWITRHLLLLTAESELHSPTSSMHTVDLEAYCYFILWTRMTSTWALMHAVTHHSLLIRMLHLQPALRWAQSVPPQLTSRGPKALHLVVLQISRISNIEHARFTFHLYMYYVQPPTRIWYPQGYFHTLLSSSPTQTSHWYLTS